MANRVVNEVDVYEEAHYTVTVAFRKKWQARLFHWILNQSIDSAGVRNY